MPGERISLHLQKISLTAVLNICIIYIGSSGLLGFQRKCAFCAVRLRTALSPAATDRGATFRPTKSNRFSPGVLRHAGRVPDFSNLLKRYAVASRLNQTGWQPARTVRNRRSLGINRDRRTIGNRWVASVQPCKRGDFAFDLWQLSIVRFVAGCGRPGDRALGERAGMLKTLERR
jgi:hypothetical protein